MTGRGILEDQREGNFSNMSERDKEIQGSIWALIFLASEQALAFRMLRNKLKEKGVLDAEDEAWINQNTIVPEKLQAAYAHVENAFNEKYQRVRFALDNPEQVTSDVEQREKMAGYDSTSKGEEDQIAPRKNSLSAVTGTITVSPDGQAEIL